MNGLVRGVAAGVAGTLALNATTYLDIAVRSRPASTTPQQTAERLAGLLRVPLPEEPGRRAAVLTRAGALLGTAAGVSAGVGVAVLRPVTRSGMPATVVTAWVLAMLAGNGPMTVLGVTDPRTWSATDWAADVVPHLAYAVAAAVVIRRLES